MFCIKHRKQNNLCIECILTEIAHFASLPSAKIQLKFSSTEMQLLRCSIIMIPVLQIKFFFSPKLYLLAGHQIFMLQGNCCGFVSYLDGHSVLT